MNLLKIIQSEKAILVNILSKELYWYKGDQFSLLMQKAHKIYILWASEKRVLN